MPQTQPQSFNPPSKTSRNQQANSRIPKFTLQTSKSQSAGTKSPTILAMTVKKYSVQTFKSESAAF
jgi:hypothetical protein